MALPLPLTPRSMRPARDPLPLAPALSSPTALASPSSTSTPSPSPPMACTVLVTTTARGTLLLTPTFSMEPTVMDTDMDTVMDTATAMATPVLEATTATAMPATTTVKQFG